MKKFRTIAGQRLHTTYQGKLLARPFHTCKVEFSRIIGPAGSASGRSNSSNSASCGNTVTRVPACRICLSAENRRPISAPKSPQRQ
ncbi:hypothetical protein CCANI_12130 [Corynebacterium canis]|nr:hypothetical protein CCANI_12130 [Corynebacterium canis]